MLDRRKRRWALLAIAALALSLAGAALAQPVYRCAGADGVAFQDTACRGGARGEKLAIEAAVPAEAPPAVQELVARYEARQRAPQRPAGKPRPRRTAAQKPAYKCTDATGRVDYLGRPCPKPRARAGKPAPVVEQQQVTQREACEGRHAQLDPYERDRLGRSRCR
ncbi:MAG TPA: DUF4124 domain-containing protein [Xanthomonadales bacterium]|nr:DUF4124 domain-containing protein [Xanthomonadales bacterium]